MKGIHLPITINEIQTGHLTSPHFKNIYFHLIQNNLPSFKTAIRQVEVQAEKVFAAWFTTVQNINWSWLTETSTVYTWAVYRPYTPSVSQLNIGNTLGIFRKILDYQRRAYIPNLMHCIRSFLKGFQTFQLHNVEKSPQRQFANRINLNYASMNKLHFDMKYVYTANTGHPCDGR